MSKSQLISVLTIMYFFMGIILGLASIYALCFMPWSSVFGMIVCAVASVSLSSYYQDPRCGAPLALVSGFFMTPGFYYAFGCVAAGAYLALCVLACSATLFIQPHHIASVMEYFERD